MARTEVRNGDDVEAADQTIVSWDGPGDPENPRNWDSRKRWTHIGIVAMVTFVSPLASSIFSPSVPRVMEEFHSTSTELAAFVVSVYILGCKC
jgi:hypothetical protein